MPHSLLNVDLLACVSAYPAFSLMLESQPVFQGTLPAVSAKPRSHHRLVESWHPVSTVPDMVGWRTLHCVISRHDVYLKGIFSVCVEVPYEHLRRIHSYFQRILSNSAEVFRLDLTLKVFLRLGMLP